MSPRRLNPRQATATVSVEPLAGEGSWGEEPGDTVTVRAQLSGDRTLVRNAAGEEVVAEQVLLVYPHPGVDVVAVIQPEAWLTIGGDRRRVITAKPVRNRGRLIYLEVTTT